MEERSERRGGEDRPARGEDRVERRGGEDRPARGRDWSEGRGGEDRPARATAQEESENKRTDKTDKEENALRAPMVPGRDSYPSDMWAPHKATRGYAERKRLELAGGKGRSSGRLESEGIVCATSGTANHRHSYKMLSALQTTRASYSREAEDELADDDDAKENIKTREAQRLWNMDDEDEEKVRRHLDISFEDMLKDERKEEIGTGDASGGSEESTCELMEDEGTGVELLRYQPELGQQERPIQPGDILPKGSYVQEWMKRVEMSVDPEPPGNRVVPESTGQPFNGSAVALEVARGGRKPLVAVRPDTWRLAKGNKWRMCWEWSRLSSDARVSGARDDWLGVGRYDQRVPKESSREQRSVRSSLSPGTRCEQAVVRSVTDNTALAYTDDEEGGEGPRHLNVSYNDVISDYGNDNHEQAMKTKQAYSYYSGARVFNEKHQHDFGERKTAADKTRRVPAHDMKGEGSDFRVGRTERARVRSQPKRCEEVQTKVFRQVRIKERLTEVRKAMLSGEIAVESDVKEDAVVRIEGEVAVMVNIEEGQRARNDGNAEQTECREVETAVIAISKEISSGMDVVGSAEGRMSQRQEAMGLVASGAQGRTDCGRSSRGTRAITQQEAEKVQDSVGALRGSQALVVTTQVERTRTETEGIERIKEGVEVESAEKGAQHLVLGNAEADGEEAGRKIEGAAEPAASQDHEETGLEVQHLVLGGGVQHLMLRDAVVDRKVDGKRMKEIEGSGKATVTVERRMPYPNRQQAVSQNVDDTLIKTKEDKNVREFSGRRIPSPRPPMKKRKGELTKVEKDGQMVGITVKTVEDSKRGEGQLLPGLVQSSGKSQTAESGNTDKVKAMDTEKTVEQVESGHVKESQGPDQGQANRDHEGSGYHTERWESSGWTERNTNKDGHWQASESETSDVPELMEHEVGQANPKRGKAVSSRLVYRRRRLLQPATSVVELLGAKVDLDIDSDIANVMVTDEEGLDGCGRRRLVAKTETDAGGRDMNVVGRKGKSYEKRKRFGSMERMERTGRMDTVNTEGRAQSGSGSGTEEWYMAEESEPCRERRKEHKESAATLELRQPERQELLPIPPVEKYDSDPDLSSGDMEKQALALSRRLRCMVGQNRRIEVLRTENQRRSVEYTTQLWNWCKAQNA